MIKVSSNGDIELTRGDTCLLDLIINDTDGNEYQIQSSDKVILTIKHNTRCKDVVLEKYFQDGCIKILPSETKTLSYGEYVYDVELRNAEGDVFTIVGPAKFKITEEVTF